MMLRALAVAAVVALTLLAPVAGRAADTYEIDAAHSSVQFSVRHMMISNVRGEFTKLSGKAVGDVANPTAAIVEATIEAASIDTRNEKRDEHLRSPDFLDVAKFPTITFKSTKVEKAGDGWKLTGDLTLHGVTKPVVLDVTNVTPPTKDPWGNTRIGAQRDHQDQPSGLRHRLQQDARRRRRAGRRRDRDHDRRRGDEEGQLARRPLRDHRTDRRGGGVGCRLAGSADRTPEPARSTCAGFRVRSIRLRADTPRPRQPALRDDGRGAARAEARRAAISVAFPANPCR